MESDQALSVYSGNRFLMLSHWYFLLNILGGWIVSAMSYFLCSGYILKPKLNLMILIPGLTRNQNSGLKIPHKGDVTGWNVFSLCKHIITHTRKLGLMRRTPCWYKLHACYCIEMILSFPFLPSSFFLYLTQTHILLSICGLDGHNREHFR